MPRTLCTPVSTAAGKIPVTSLLMVRSAWTARKSSRPSTRSRSISATARAGGFTKFQPDVLKGQKALSDLIDADTGEVVVESGKKLTPRLLKTLTEKGLKAIKATDDELYGNFLAEDLVNPTTGEIFSKPAMKSTRRRWGVILTAGFDEIPILDIDHINVGAYIRNTLSVDKNENRQDALFETSTVSCVPASRRPWIRLKPCSTRCSSMRSVTTSRPLAASR